ncbi:MAG TPA: hypothetical protein VD963_10190 [Phycisphaerales bacterium]|nr:hypothetical protein [Phycisphaerales bacterium]
MARPTSTRRSRWPTSGSAGAAVPEATAFAATVLGAAREVEPSLSRGDDFILFWHRVGRIAFHAANDARERGETAEAMALVLAGPAHWQTEAYWRRYDDHEALTAYILYENGGRTEAIQRLRARPVLGGQAERALKDIEAAP